MKGLVLAASAAFAACCAAFSVQPAHAQAAGVNAGVLTCQVDRGWGFVFGSSRDLKCSFSRPGYSEHYIGKISRFGVDIGYLEGGVMVWTVIAPTTDLAPGRLAGNYTGASGGASVGVGAGANVLIGGSAKSMMLQPVSIEANTGLNVAAGIAALSLSYQNSHQISSR